MAGLGWYRNDCPSATVCAEETRFGWNAGLGTHLYFLTVRSFIEARYHAAGDGLSYLPVTIGFSF